MDFEFALGRIVIPKSVREKLNMEQGDNIEFYVDDNKVLLKKSAPIDVHEEEIFKLLQLYYIKYYKSSVMVENDNIVLEYGKDVEVIKEFIKNKNLDKLEKIVNKKFCVLFCCRKAEKSGIRRWRTHPHRLSSGNGP